MQIPGDRPDTTPRANAPQQTGRENAITVTETTDAPGSTVRPCTIATGDSLVGALNFAADTDWVGITLTAGVTYTITMSAGIMEDPWLLLLDSGGSYITHNDDGSGPGLNSQIVFTPTTGGTCYIAASPRPLAISGISTSTRASTPDVLQ